MSRFIRQRLEKDIEAQCREIAARNGCRLIKLVSPGNPGVPDRLLLMPGRHVVIEFKRPGKKPTELQSRWHDIFDAAGFEVWRTVDDVEDFYRRAGFAQ